VGEGTTLEHKATTPDRPRLVMGAQEDPRDPASQGPPLLCENQWKGTKGGRT